MKKYNGVPLIERDFEVIELLEKKIGKALSLILEKQLNFLGFKALDGKVTHLSIFEVKLNNFPIEIFKLSNLKSLSLSDVNINTIPEEIINLNLLEKLDLSYNNIEKLPETIGKLTTLKSLYLSGNRLKKIPDSISSLTSLRELVLTENVDLTNLSPTIWDLKNLEYLDLNLTDIKYIPDDIGNLTNLKVLGLELSLKTLPLTLRNLDKLEVIELSFYHYEDFTENILEMLEEMKERGVDVALQP